MKNPSGKRRSRNQNSMTLPSAVALALGATLACGVAPHNDRTHAVDTRCDFGDCGGSQSLPPPSGAAGTATTTGGSGTVVTGGMNATGGMVGTGGTSSVGGASTGGVPPAGGTSAGGTVATAGSAANGGAATGINLGGTNVPADHIIGFIHIGHSNMAGRATSPAASKPYHFTQTAPHAWMYHPGSQPALAIEPKTAGDMLNVQQAGPGTALVKEAAALAPNYYFMSLGYAVPSAYCSQFVPGGLYYDKLIEGPKAIRGKITFGAIFIYLGITERHGTDADRNGFSTCINTLVTNIRKDVGVPDLPAIMNDYEVGATGELAVGSAEYNAIYPQIQMCPTVVSNFMLVPTDGVGMQDDHHFNLDGQLTWAKRALMLMQQRGTFKWN